MDQQNEPVEDGHGDASSDDKLAGIVEQTRQDIAMGNVTDTDQALRERLSDAGMDVSDEEYAQLRSQM